MKQLGIDMGSLYLGAVLLNNDKIVHTAYFPHEGNPVKALKKAADKLSRGILQGQSLREVFQEALDLFPKIKLKTREAPNPKSR